MIVKGSAEDKRVTRTIFPKMEESMKTKWLRKVRRNMTQRLQRSEAKLSKLPSFCVAVFVFRKAPVVHHGEVLVGKMLDGFFDLPEEFGIDPDEGGQWRSDRTRSDNLIDLVVGHTGTGNTSFA